VSKVRTPGAIADVWGDGAPYAGDGRERVDERVVEEPAR